MPTIFIPKFATAVGGGGGSSFTYLAHAAAATNANSATTGTIDTTGVDLIVVAVSAYNGYSTIADSKSNSWNSLTSQINGSGGTMQMFWCRPSSVGSGHTFTANTISAFPTILVSCFSGSNASPFDSETGTTGSGTTIQPGSITPSVNNSLLVTAISDFTNTGTRSINSSFSITDDYAYGAGVNIAGGMAYKIQSLAGAENPTWTVASNALSVVMASFKPA